MQHGITFGDTKFIVDNFVYLLYIGDCHNHLIKGNNWISAATWKLINNRAQLRKQGSLPQTNGRKLGREIKSLLKEDRKRRAANAAADIPVHLADGSLKEA